MESNHESYIHLLAEQARALSPDIRQWRSRLHCHPELSGQENDTMAFVCKQRETGWVFPGSGSSTAAWPPPFAAEGKPAGDWCSVPIWTHCLLRKATGIWPGPNRQ